jgi:hypothetical protein
MDDELDFEEWLRIGLRNAWGGPPVCYTHDGLPLSEAEDEEFSEGDPCIHIIRLYESGQHKKDVEDNHSASTWRATNRGIETDGTEKTGQDPS